MLFNSLTFVVFFAVLLGLYNIIPSWKSRKTLLLIASYLFYAAWNPPFILLLWLSTIVDWKLAGRIAATESHLKRKSLLWTSIALNLGLLGFFKYSEFLLNNFTVMLKYFGINYQYAAHDIILPVGISFYTFQTMSYTLDIYLRRSKPCDSFLDFALYVTFFPQLVAGPIVRATDFLPQCIKPLRTCAIKLGWGLFLLSLGLFEKVVLADGLVSKPAEIVFSATAPIFWLDAWIGVFAFASQIFCDFAGYSTCAIGAALCFGFSLPDNFRFPYAAIGFSDFWKRWHISLSTWLRDYLYIPLGGNRMSNTRAYINIMLTMLLGGLWHGANWTFVAWGGLHGAYLTGERFLKARFRSKVWANKIGAKFLFAMTTYFLILITWVFFRAPNFAAAGSILASLFGGHPEGDQILSTLQIVQVLIVTVGINTTHWLMRYSTLETLMVRLPVFITTILWVLMVCAVILMQGAGNAFIYFQF